MINPCVYREHNTVTQVSLSDGGLSLCVQGTFCACIWILRKSRFIPVCTGNMEKSFVLSEAITVYPCVYREHMVIVTVII